jgi:hypothetical protein
MVAASLPLAKAPITPRRTAGRLVWWGRAYLRAAYTGVMAARPPDPYRPLRVYLADQPGEELTLTFSEIESLLGMSLPDGAWLRAWWTNTPAAPQARSWLRTGWRVHWVRRSGTEAAVTFTRAAGVPRPGRASAGDDDDTADRVH